MYAAVTHVKLKEGGKKKVGELATKMDLPDIRAIPGFLAYYVVNEEGDDYTTVAVFEDPSGWQRWQEMSTEASGQFAEHLRNGPSDVQTTAGHVVFSRTHRS